MADPIIDLLNNIIQYNGKEITIIVDDKNDLWFSGPDISNILEYKDTRQAIKRYVSSKNKKLFSELQHFLEVIPKDIKPQSVFINEAGLYSLVLYSRKPVAMEFRDWVTEKVLPSTRKTGSYTVQEKSQKKIGDLNNKLKKANKQIRILKSKQKLDRLDTQKGGNGGEDSDVLQELFTIDVKSARCFDRYCNNNLQIVSVPNDRDNNYYACRLDKIQDLLIKCHENNNIDNEINDSIHNHDLQLSDTIVIAIANIPEIVQSNSHTRGRNNAHQFGGNNNNYNLSNIMRSQRHDITNSETYKWLYQDEI